ncbi:1-(5-phosphoribosyl)-5-((5-phosphoribosylamino)methylideneamino)imidazole-4-carboxamide isomerase [Thermococcus alcaliphilus]|uniref:1-(5-phosphoribosyl)-5-((5- phosphoribosylamino)methylideneamino)imidazole-4- carboxamide isomerase n=1 Tax=Thermococcus alcaliphilus TaxID=139207 RepID=UPI002091D0E0|nr:1-(5-phosphoribosyl)-5-((5-phosphoribosylamino)methylideneamino)imidazole-4-carboxamide isomerase [Thermococcus alcaliphilus]MCO6041930.1 1-(5-phosphoribosyl)-5-((5-phosphoribosylamino)methylideneamino)imidazole-4-carboxamide isomerase [Thermococcus alcaliphilus]
MEVYPAIDIMSGKAVRLYKGRKENVKVYGNPVEIAERFANYVDKIHIVDLDGAFTGNPQNLDVVKEIIDKTGMKVQIGGGFRSYESIAKAYKIGVENVIIGTKAFDTEFLEKVVRDFDGITVSLDARGGKIVLKGWVEESSLKVEEAYEMLKDYIDRFIYTATEKDGTLTGIGNIKRFWGKEEFIYAGGVSSIDDILKLKGTGFSGVIIGKALYEGKIKLQEVLEALKC